MAHRLRRSLEPPHQSRFRVVCVIEYVDDGGASHVVTGTNAEPGYIGGSICAERAALCKLREAPFVARVASVTVVTDADAPLCPSVLCREFLATHLDRDVTVIMSGARDEDRIETCRIGDLYPFPCIYGVTDREALLRHGFEFARRADAPETAIRALGLSAAVAEAYELAQRETARDAKDALHPIRYAAVVVYEDGTSAAAHQLKAAEYGSTLDPVSQLLRGMLDRKLDDGARATHIVQVDQFGNCHAPFAPARALLTEHGFADVAALSHDAAGRLHAVAAAALVPRIGGELSDADIDSRGSVAPPSSCNC